ncbi:hypothetical protein ABI_33310 [Asticcacaulis biprosthecium C19]|uniref:Uncharacterized protein n=1 Tax=Asticcacaulis biprosthecium C19 TaxID=715226 RepID=F4QQ26_9CAUL|nr:hypothetical protein [Asticcacaulis biprosthecium]EGF90313.1 hypothetical protein ABI_33310 [Asticcacaulis biprosthecium C19]
MSEDALKALLQAEVPAQVPGMPPVRDIAFVIAVMEKVERRRFVENLAWWLCGGCAVTLVMGLIMPYVTPAIITLGGALVPVVIILSVVGMIALGAWYLRPALRDFGIQI